MKNKVTIFVGPARSGKSILIHSYIDDWVQAEDVGVYERSRGPYIR